VFQAQVTQEVKRADLLSGELARQQDESARGLRSSKSRATSDLLMGRSPTQGGGGGPPSDPLIPAGRPAGAASTAGSELELLRRKLKVILPLPGPILQLFTFVSVPEQLLLLCFGSCPGRQFQVSLF